MASIDQLLMGRTGFEDTNPSTTPMILAELVRHSPPELQQHGKEGRGVLGRWYR